MKKYIEKLKTKWEIQSDFQMVIVFIVFAITGSSSVKLANPLLNFLGIQPEMNPWIRIPLRILIVLPVYQIMLLVIGTAFGQFRFFFKLQKRWLRIGGKNNPNNLSKDFGVREN